MISFKDFQPEQALTLPDHPPFHDPYHNRPDYAIEKESGQGMAGPASVLSWVGSNLFLHLYPYGDPIPITDKSAMTYNHSGQSNSVIQEENYVIVAWASNEENGTGTRQMISIVDISTRKVVREELVYVVPTKSGKPDSHDQPAITRTPDEVLHILMAGHHRDLKYSRSTNGQWDSFTDPVTVGVPNDGAGHTYPALVNDSNGSLYVFTRDASVGYHFKLVLNKMDPDGIWVPQVTIAEPGRAMYGGYYHDAIVTLDDRVIVRSPGVLFAQLVGDEIDLYDTLYPGEIDKSLIDDRGILQWQRTQNLHHPFQLEV